MESRTPAMRREELVALYRQVRDCPACPLSATRTNAVFGAGHADSDLMFVGEAPGFHEDQQGLPFVGRAGKLLDELLERIGLARPEVFVANVLKCRPPGNRDPQPEEIDHCKPYLYRQVELIEPRVVCTLGNFSTKLLSRSSQGITRVHGKPQPHRLGDRSVWLYPLFHPAAALRTPATLATLREDFERIPRLLEQPLPEPPGLAAATPQAEPPGLAAATPQTQPQLDLFG